MTEANGESDRARETESDEKPWPDVKARPRSFFGAPLCTDLNELDADIG